VPDVAYIKGVIMAGMPQGGIGVDPMKSQQYRTQRSELPEDLWQPLYDRVNN
jgi:hypothetical protein